MAGQGLGVDFGDCERGMLLKCQGINFFRFFVMGLQDSGVEGWRKMIWLSCGAAALFWFTSDVL